MRRRDFIRRSLLAGTTLSGYQVLQSCTTPVISVPSFKGKRLILLKLDGGNDGLFTFFPREHDFIDARRTQLSKFTKSNSIPFSGDWHLNYYFKDLLDVLESSEIAILPYVGYPQPNTSHFKSTEIWETARLPGASSEKTGWIGRLMDSGKLGIPGNEAPVLSVVDSEVLVDKGLTMEGYSWGGSELLQWYEKDLQHWLDHYRYSRLGDQMLRQYTMLQWLSDTNTLKGFPDTVLGDQLAKVAAMIQADKPFRVFYTTQEGYDTHLGAPSRLSRLYSDLGNSLSVFIRALKSSGHWRETLVFVYSEFGRTIDENENLGTDHGTAGLSILLGHNPLVEKYSKVKPEIQIMTLANEAYLSHQIDFRDLYRDLEEQWLL